MLFETYNNFNIRLSQDKDKVQVNIFNPQREGHSYCFTLVYQEGQELQNLYAGLVSSGILEEKCSKAITCFESFIE